MARVWIAYICVAIGAWDHIGCSVTVLEVCAGAFAFEVDDSCDISAHRRYRWYLIDPAGFLHLSQWKLGGWTSLNVLS